jgi:hypothetical protein
MNPHMDCIALSPAGASSRLWRCRFCGAEGRLEQLMGPTRTIECSYVYPPCDRLELETTAQRAYLGLVEKVRECRVHYENAGLPVPPRVLRFLDDASVSRVEDDGGKLARQALGQGS